MTRSFLNSKIHKGTITGTDINYEGSCLIDISILNAAKILPFEKIDIYNIKKIPYYLIYSNKMSISSFSA